MREKRASSNGPPGDKIETQDMDNLIIHMLGRGASYDRAKRHRKEAWTRYE